MMMRQQAHTRVPSYRQSNYDYEEKLNSEINKYFSPTEETQEDGNESQDIMRFRGGVMTQPQNKSAVQMAKLQSQADELVKSSVSRGNIMRSFKMAS